VYGPSVSLGISPFERAAFGVGFQGPLSGASASAAGATVSLQNEQLFAEMRYRPIFRPRWAIETTLAVGAHFLSVDGTARAPYLGRSDSAITSFSALGLGFELKLLPLASLVVSGRVVLLGPRPVVRFAGTEVPYGRPALQAGAGLRVEF